MLFKTLASLAFAALAFAGSHGKVVVADRNSATLTVIDVETDTPSTVAMPPGERKPEPMYVVSWPFSRSVFVGDRANNRVVVLDSKDFSLKKEVRVGAGVWHMWTSARCRQLWVVGDIDKTMTVIDTQSLNVVATVPTPPDLAALGGRPHDVILDPTQPFAYVTFLGLSEPWDYVVKYSTITFTEVGRQRVGKDPHLSLTWTNNLLYVPCQGGNQVVVLDRRTMTVMTTIAIPGAHGAGMPLFGHRFFTTSFTSSGENGLYAVDLSRNTVAGVANVPFPTPHNIVLTPFGDKLYVTHSGATNSQVSVYRVSFFDPTPRLLKTITAGVNPFGLDFVP